MRGLGSLGVWAVWAAWAFLGNACDQEPWAIGADLVRQDLCCKYQALALTWRLLAALGDAWHSLACLGGNVVLLGSARRPPLCYITKYPGRPEGWAAQPISAAQPPSPDCQDSAKHSANVTAMRAKA